MSVASAGGMLRPAALQTTSRGVALGSPIPELAAAYNTERTTPPSLLACRSATACQLCTPCCVSCPPVRVDVHKRQHAARAQDALALLDLQDDPDVQMTSTLGNRLEHA